MLDPTRPAHPRNLIFFSGITQLQKKKQKKQEHEELDVCLNYHGKCYPVIFPFKELI